MMRARTSGVVSVFVVCSHKDTYFLDALVPLLMGVPGAQVKPRSDKDIMQGQRLDLEIKEALAEMDVFIPLVSVNFAASEYINKVESPVAKQRFENGEIEVLPVLIHKPAKYHCEWLMKLDRVPPGKLSWAEVLNEFPHHDMALAPICDGFYEVVERAKNRINLKFKGLKEADVFGVSNNEGGKKKMHKRAKTYSAEELEKLKRLMNGEQITQNFHGGTFIGPIAAKMEACVSIINLQTEGERRDLLQTIERQARDILSRHAADKQGDIAEDLERFVKEATAEKPSRKWYSLSAKGLLEASDYVKKLSGNLVDTLAMPIEKLGKLFWPDFSLPEISPKE